MHVDYLKHCIAEDNYSIVKSFLGWQYHCTFFKTEFLLIGLDQLIFRLFLFMILFLFWSLLIPC